MNVAALNAAFPRYPITVSVKGWTYGVWYCGTSWTKVKLYGQYPPTFLKRALALFPDAKDILHCPSGTVTGPGLTIDATKDDVRCPQIIANASSLPLPDSSLDLVLSDPPAALRTAPSMVTSPSRLAPSCANAIGRSAWAAILECCTPTIRRIAERIGNSSDWSRS